MGKCMLVAVAGLAFGANAQVVMDFQDLEQAGTGFAEWGNTYSANGYSILQDPSESFPLTTAQTGNTGFYQGSTMLFNNTVNGVINLVRDDGGAFDMASIGLAALFVGGGIPTINFVGDLAGGGQVFESITLSTSVGIETYNFSTFNDVVRVSWVQENSFHQFDDIAIVPAPGAFALLGAAGLAATRRRR